MAQRGKVAKARGGRGMRQSDRVYCALREMLIKGEIPPGALIEEGRLCRELGVGRTPMREAILRLATEGLVSILPRRGTFASELVFSDVQDLLELRWYLEAVAARLAASRITDKELDAMERLFQGVDRLAPASPDHVRIDTEFHRIIQQATRNRYLADTLAQLHTLSLRLMFVTKAKAAELPDALGQYLAVVEAMRRRDPEDAERAMHAHLEDFRERLRASL